MFISTSLRLSENSISQDLIYWHLKLFKRWCLRCMLRKKHHFQRVYYTTWNVVEFNFLYTIHLKYVIKMTNKFKYVYISSFRNKRLLQCAALFRERFLLDLQHILSSVSTRDQCLPPNCSRNTDWIFINLVSNWR